MKPIAAFLILALCASPAYAQDQDSLPPKPKPHAAPALTTSFSVGYFEQQLDNRLQGEARRFENSDASSAPNASQTIDAGQAAAPLARPALPSVSEAIAREQSVEDDPRAPPSP